MAIPQRLLEGYRLFRRDKYGPIAESFLGFADGQDPDFLVIACADSRVDPAMTFNAGPGELFVLRNVAALVPPYQPDGSLHGVSAGLEFGVRYLNVKHIVVMGHGLCGGVNACLHAGSDGVSGEFIKPWVELAAPAREAVERELPNGSEEERQRLGEYRAVEVSLKNLDTFPFIRERVESGALTVHGAWYSVYKGHLRWRDPASGTFELIDEETS